MKSTLFLRNFTNIDHAYIDENGQVIGGSFHASATVSGSVSEDEKVVIDFSTCKRDLKKLIDDHADGYDHKLWIIEGVSSIEIDTGTQIVTSACELLAPKDMYKRFAASRYHSYSIETVLSKELTAKMAELYPLVDVEVKIHLDQMPFSYDTNRLMFRYSHGLKNSSSVGCRRHSHGHLSFIEFVGARISDEFVEVRDLIRTRINNAIFIWRDNVVADTNDIVHIHYVACDGNEYSAKYSKQMNNLIILDTETTIEYLAEYIKQQFGYKLKQLGCARLFVSEGLQKGAVVDL